MKSGQYIHLFRRHRLMMLMILVSAIAICVILLYFGKVIDSIEHDLRKVGMYMIDVLSFLTRFQ